IVKSGRGDAATKTWAGTAGGAEAGRAGARAKPPRGRQMGVIVHSGRPMTHVGRAARRREDPPLLRGEGRFLDDLRIEGVAHVVFVRSPHAHARVAALDIDIARKAAGVVAVVTGAELDSFPPIGMMRGIEGMVVPEMLFVASDEVRWQGTPIAAVGAESAALAHGAAALVRVEWAALPDVGGGFGVKGGPYREEVLIPWLARRLGRPVKWISTRVEDLLTTHHGRGAVARGELAVAADGTMLGLRARILCPLGPSVGYTAMGTPRNHVRCLPGPYAIAAVDVEAVGAFTTTPPVGPYRGAGRPEAAFLMERLVDEAARALALDPAELRRRNLVPPERFPFTTATGQSYDSGDYPDLLARVLVAADYAGLRRAQAERRPRGELVGVGLSVYVEPSALGWESGLVRVEADGRVTAVTGSSAHGQGHE